MPSGTGEFHTKFLQSLADGATADHVAEVAVATWRDITAAMAPIIGQPGVAALLRRSQYLVRPAHPWLATFQDEMSAGPSFDALYSALSSQAADESARGNAALLEIFHNLLVNLIGPSLSERLLRSVYPPTSSGPAAQDPLP